MKKYKIKYQDETSIKELVLETNDLSKQELPKGILSIKEIKTFDLNELLNSKKIPSKQINLVFYELDLMLSAGLNLNDSINILIKNKKSKTIKEFLSILKESLVNKTSDDRSFKKLKVSFLIPAFLKLSSKRGNIEANIKALNILLNESESSKKEFLKTIRYPLVLIVCFIFSLISIFYIVVPKFKVMFEQSQSELPLATKSLLLVHHIFENYLFIIIILFCFIIFTLIVYYKRSTSLQYSLDKFLLKKVFIFKDLLLNYELYKIFLLIDVMQKNNYEFHNALSSSKVLLKNQYLLDRIYAY